MKPVHRCSIAVPVAFAVCLAGAAGVLCPAAGTAAPQFLRGDANDDGVITLADVIYVAAYLYGGGPAPLPYRDSADVDCDRHVDLTDVVDLVNYVVRGGPAPGCPT